jgi:hypothetical protein
MSFSWIYVEGSGVVLVAMVDNFSSVWTAIFALSAPTASIFRTPKHLHVRVATFSKTIHTAERLCHM